MYHSRQQTSASEGVSEFVNVSHRRTKPITDAYPRAMAPPLTLTFSGSSPRVSTQYTIILENASLIYKGSLG